MRDKHCQHQNDKMHHIRCTQNVHAYFLKKTAHKKAVFRPLLLCHFPQSHTLSPCYLSQAKRQFTKSMSETSEQIELQLFFLCHSLLVVSLFLSPSLPLTHKHTHIPAHTPPLPRLFLPPLGAALLLPKQYVYRNKVCACLK